MWFRSVAKQLAIVLFTALGACQSLPRPVVSDVQIWDVQRERFVDEDTVVASLKRTRFRLLGEVHDNPLHHLIQARLITAIAVSSGRPAIVFEQFDLDHDAALLALPRGSFDAERVASAGQLDRKGWQWPLHKPVIEAALAARMPVRAGNIGRSQLMVLARDGYTALPALPWRGRLYAAPWTAQKSAALRSEIADAHCGTLPDNASSTLVLAQRIRDAALAQALAADATEDGAVLIAGNEHVRRDQGVPLYLLPVVGRGPSRQLVSVGIVETTTSERAAVDYPVNVVADHPGFDFVWLTTALVRPDPCVAMRGAADGANR